MLQLDGDGIRVGQVTGGPGRNGKVLALLSKPQVQRRIHKPNPLDLGCATGDSAFTGTTAVAKGRNSLSLASGPLSCQETPIGNQGFRGAVPTASGHVGNNILRATKWDGGAQKSSSFNALGYSAAVAGPVATQRIPSTIQLLGYDLANPQGCPPNSARFRSP
jgi:hypothetical protein